MTDAPTNVPLLHEATIDELLDEVHRRYPHWIFWGLQGGKSADDSSLLTFRFQGGRVELRGLADDAYSQVKRWADQEVDRMLDAQEEEEDDTP